MVPVNSRLYYNQVMNATLGSTNIESALGILYALVTIEIYAS